MSTKIENPLVTIRFIYYLKVKLSIFFTLKIIYERERIRARAGGINGFNNTWIRNDFCEAE